MNSPYLAPAEYVDSDHPDVVARSYALCADAADQGAAARAIFVFVRDLTYEGDDFEDLSTFRASDVLRAGHGYCVGKAALAAALARAAGLPARVAFADVRNHLASPRLLAWLGTDLFAWHGYVELHLGGRWVRASPTFDARTCAAAGVPQLEFDGVHDALLQAFDGSASMAYVTEHGSFHDVPARFLSAEMRRRYPAFADRGVTRYKRG